NLAYFTGLGGRGFILFRTGFFGGGMTSHVPPAFSIFSFADFVKWCAFTVNFLERSPSPSTRRPSKVPTTRRFPLRAAISTVLLASYSSRSPTLTMAQSFWKRALEKPRLGK